MPIFVGLDWSPHYKMTMQRLLAAMEKHLGRMYLVGSFVDSAKRKRSRKSAKLPKAPSTAEYFDSKKEEWVPVRMNHTHFRNNGGCMVKGEIINLDLFLLLI